MEVLHIGDFVKLKNEHETFWVCVTSVVPSENKDFNQISGIISTDLDYGHLYNYHINQLVTFTDNYISRSGLRQAASYNAQLRLKDLETLKNI